MGFEKKQVISNFSE